MPTKDERIANLEREVDHLKEQLKFCKMVAEGKPLATATGRADTQNKPFQNEAKSSETVSPTPQPAASSSGPSETKQT